MSRFSRRVWGFVIAIVAVELGIQALTFRFDYSPARDRAWSKWHQNPTQDSEAAWRAALAETQQRERKVRWVFAGVAVATASAATWLILRRSSKPDLVSLGQG